MGWQRPRTLTASNPTQSSQKIAEVLARIPEHGNPYAGSGCRLVGIVDVGEDIVGTQIAGVPVLGTPRELTRLVKQHDIDLLVIALRHAPTAESDLFEALLNCRELGVDMELMTGLYERLTGRLLVEHAGRDLDLIVPVPDSAIKHCFRAGKRILDLIAGVCGLLVLALLAPFIALAKCNLEPWANLLPAVTRRQGRQAVLHLQAPVHDPSSRGVLRRSLVQRERPSYHASGKATAEKPLGRVSPVSECAQRRHEPGGPPARARPSRIT